MLKFLKQLCLTASFQLLAFFVVANDIAANETAATPPKELSDEIKEALPAWLARTSFQVRDRLVLKLDGSEEAGGILKNSESSNRLIFLNSDNWRVLREYPFVHTSREIMSVDGNHFFLSLRNRKVNPPHPVSNSTWIEVVLAPFRMAKTLGFEMEAKSFSDWIEEVQKIEGELQTDNGGKLRVEKKETDQGKILRLVLEGYYIHQAKTKVHVLEEWTLEYDVRITKKDLETSLIGGSS